MENYPKKDGTRLPNSNNLYRHVNVPVRWLTAGIMTGLAVMAAVILFLVSNGGFSVTFETDGGSHVSGQTRMYGEAVEEPDPPVREGCRFGGWYWDKDQAHAWDFAADTVEGDLVLYARWIPKG